MWHRYGGYGITCGTGMEVTVSHVAQVWRELYHMWLRYGGYCVTCGTSMEVTVLRVEQLGRLYCVTCGTSMEGTVSHVAQVWRILCHMGHKYAQTLFGKHVIKENQKTHESSWNILTLTTYTFSLFLNI